jgi:acetyl esterase
MSFDSNGSQSRNEADAALFDPKGPFVTDLPDPPGLSHIDPHAKAAPYLELIGRLRSPISLRELMIQPVRTGYIGQPNRPPAADLPPSAASLFPQIGVRELGLPCRDGMIRCQVFSPPGENNARPVVLYLHGGGFMVGSSEDTASITSRIAADTGAVVVSANFRLAPEWPFPYGIEDSYAVLTWLQANAALVGGDPRRIAVAGDSSGGNFAAVMPLMARDRGASLPVAAVLLCPITDFYVEEYASFERLAPKGIVYDTAFVGFARGAYLVHHRNWPLPYASPARAELSGYPPTLVVSGTSDPMIDDNRAFVGKLRGAGVAVEAFERPDMPHGYYFFPHVLPEGNEALAAVSRSLNTRF